MPVFKYSVRDHAGKIITGKITADSEAIVIAQLRKSDVFITSIEEEKIVSASMELPKSAPIKRREKRPRKKKITSKDIVIFSRQFATMVDANIPISQAMDALVEQTINPSLKQILEQIAFDVREGNGLSVSFGKYPKVFDALYVNMIKVGEAGGILGAVLDRVALFLAKSENLKQKVNAAMMYPIVVVSIAMLITTGLIVKVVPTFSRIYDSLGQKLPAMTQVLIDFSELMRRDFVWIIAFIVGMIFLFRWYKKTPAGRFQVDYLSLRIPIVGDLLSKVVVSRFCHTFATLIQSGVPMLESLEVVGKSSGNRVIELLTEDIKNSVKEGEGISAPLVKSSVFPVMVTRMISIGEKSGQLDKMMMRVAEFYDEELDTALDGLTKIIEPVVIGFLGIVIGFIVVALFMPILNLSAVIQ